MSGDQRLKVLFLPLWYPQPGRQTWVSGVFVQEHARAAARYDEVAVLFRVLDAAEGQLPSGETDAQGVTEFGYRYRDLPVPGASWLAGLPAVHRGFRQVVEQWGMPDLIHAQEPMPAYWARLLQRRYGIPYVVSHHWSGFQRGSASYLQRRLARNAFPKASAVLAANESAAEILASRGIGGRVHWMPNAYDEALFSPPDKPPDEHRVLHVSGMTPPKRILDVIDSFAGVLSAVPDATLVLAGDGQMRAEAEQRAAATLPPDRYRFLGFLDKAAVADEMRRASVLLLPSEYENQPCVLIEARASGLPVVTTPVGSIPRIVGTDGGLYVEVGDQQAIADATTSILTERDRFDPTRLADDARERFSADAVGRRLHEEHAAAVAAWVRS